MKKAISYILSADCLMGKLMLACIYALAYDFMYENFVYKLFSYIGNIDYVEIGIENRVLWILLSVLPFAAYRGLTKLSSFFSLFLYLFVYLPFIHAIFVAYNISQLQIYSYSLAMMVIMISLFKLGGEWTLLRDIVVKPQISLRTIEIITLVLTLLYVAIAHSSMHFVNIFTQSGDMYAYREQNSEVESLGGIAYVQGWLFGAFYPFLLVSYLKMKRRKMALLPLIGYFLLFAVDMQKMTFLMPFALIFMYYVISLNEEKICNYLHSFMMVCILIISLVLYIFQDDEIVFTLAAIVLLRTVCVAGWLTQFYIHFFNENPYTYYSHINIVNYITESYPYTEPLGKVVAYGSQNANANFFLTDGVAACGLVGIVMIGLFFATILMFINSISARYKKSDMFIMFMPTIAYFLNASIFTTLLSSGLFILIILVACFKDDIKMNGYENC
ncbi:hypothetical protein [uncultured Prevotella sp.]|mgnify:FL=1|uniref:hypothetical protein n=1 Tax=uncultured Prevotella sp. TaxID=159272 RepID=UPI0026233C4D|nr:hypothetical protein [uncultured Prevotella sp.]